MPRALFVHRPESMTLDLSKFLGTWVMEGRTFASPFTKDGGVRGKESFAWLGEAFLVHRLDGTLGDSPMSCIDLTDQAGTMRAFYNDGAQRDFDLRPDGDDFHLTNTIDANGVTYHNRCIVRFLDAGTREATWQCSRDGEDWTTYWKSISKRSPA
jgi:hypothetical protein